MANLLIIEDDPSAQEIFSTVLRHVGHAVVLAGDGRTGLERALTGEYDLVLLDIGLPEMNGTEVLRRMRSDARGRDIPVVVITAHREVVDDPGHLTRETKDVVTKPIPPMELVRIVERCLPAGRAG